MWHLLHFLQVFLLLRSSNLHSLNLKHWLEVQPGHNCRLFAWLVDSKERYNTLIVLILNWAYIIGKFTNSRRPR
jgi:hypothetical protein